MSGKTTRNGRNGRGANSGGASPHGVRARKNGTGAADEGALERLSRNMAIATGRPAAFIIACAVILVWIAAGPLFGFSDTWQLLINTGTTIVTFLMVFMIQRSQNRDTMALQAKLAELVIAVKGAKNEVAVAEEFSEHELHALHELQSEEAQRRLDRMEQRAAAMRAGKPRPAAGAK
jgi:low affinity Fe/Cu permease